MPRFFIPEADSFTDTAYIGGRDAEHIRVLRLRPGEELTVCNGRGTDYVCRLISSSKDGATAEIIRVEASCGEPGVCVTVYCGLPKGDKAELIVQKCVETGAKEIVFFDSERVIQRTDGVSKKLERWGRIAEEAAKQCGRGIIPAVRWIDGFDEMINEASNCDAVFFMYEAGEREAFSEALGGSKTLATAAVITGPEGGFEESEAQKARERGFHICSMGKRILRCETAPVAALTALMFASGNLD